MTIRHRIHELIEKKEITKLQLARDAGIDFEVLDNSLDSNIPFKSAVILSKIAKYFRVSIHWLITGEQENHETRRRLNTLLEENFRLNKEVKELKSFISKNIPCSYDEYLNSP
jgi:transcriptional regulator with XRE-family HTH domain